MFSRTMMASSMTMPTARVSPSSVIEFNVKSIARSSVKVVTIEVGMASEAISTVRQSRMNSHTMMEANRLPSTRCSSSALTEFLM